MKKVLSRFDIFSASPVLRANGEAEVVNLCGSIFSICIFSVFCFIFFSNIVSITNLQRISATEIVQTSSNNNKRVTNVTAAFGLYRLNISQLRHIFQIRAFISDENDVLTNLRLFPCTRQYWQSLTDTAYQVLQLNTFLCIQRQGVELYGEDNSPKVRKIYLRFGTCNNITSPITCGTPAQISDYFTNRTSIGQHFACSLAILDTSFNPPNENPLVYTVHEKTMFMIFNIQQQIFGQIYLGIYEINTDTSFLPFNDIKKQQGYFIQSSNINSMVNYRNLPIIAHLYISLKPVNRIIDRQYGKFDNVLSYVGGLYGIVISFFAFFMLSFNQYKYELRVSQGAFSYSEGHLARQKDFHFGKYLKYVTYDWIKTLFCCQLGWEDCKAIEQARQQANQQIDVKQLLRRISHLQKVIGMLVSQDHEAIISLIQSNSIQQAKYRRNIHQYCQKFTQGSKALTINNYELINAMISLGLSQNTIQNQIKRETPYENLEKSKELQQVNKDSFEIMQEFVEKYEEEQHVLQINFDLSQQDLKVQESLAQAFYNLKQKTRISIIRRIPLGILYRFSLLKGKQDEQKEGSSLLRPLQIHPTLQSLNKPKVKKRKEKNRSSVLTFEDTIMLKKMQPDSEN